MARVPPTDDFLHWGLTRDGENIRNGQTHGWLVGKLNVNATYTDSNGVSVSNGFYIGKTV